MCFGVFGTYSTYRNVVSSSANPPPKRRFSLIAVSTPLATGYYLQSPVLLLFMYAGVQPLALYFALQSREGLLAYRSYFPTYDLCLYTYFEVCSCNFRLFVFSDGLTLK